MSQIVSQDAKSLYKESRISLCDVCVCVAGPHALGAVAGDWMLYNTHPLSVLPRFLIGHPL